MVTTERERAKNILVEIVRQAGGKFRKKTNLYKAFYHAHLFFAKSNPAYLSSWPIVKMPQGPGIHDGDQLIAELIAEGAITERAAQMGDLSGFVYMLHDVNAGGEFTTEEIAAIRQGTEKVNGRPAREVSEETHVDSLSWNRTERQGDELNIYIDHLSAEEYDKRVAEMRRLADIN